MATIFRGKVITAVAVLSTTAAINSQPITNRLALTTPAAQKPKTLSDFPNPVQPLPQPYIHDVRNRLVLQPPPPTLKDFPNPASPIRGVFVHHHRPEITAPPIKPPGLTDFPTPASPVRTIYVQHHLPEFVTDPDIHQLDWPIPAQPIRSLTADAILNPDAFLLKPVPSPFNFTDWTNPAPAQAWPKAQWPHRPHQDPIVAPPYIFTDWINPVAPRPQILVEPFRNGLVLPVPVVGTNPTSQYDWPIPSRLALKPDTHLFYYIQDQTKPGFINYDWPIPPKLPSLTWDFVPNRLLFPFVAPPPPFRQQDWPNASTVQIAKIVDPYNRNVFLPIPQGQPGHQYDWPNPQGPRLKPDTHLLNDLGIVARPVVNPVIRNYDWPLPARVMLLTVIWTPEGTTPIYLPTFRVEWAENSNQIVGPWEPTPETH
jgi:hypothetical protein